MNEEELEAHKKYRREYMRKYNATPKGREYNRRHVREWRKRNPDKAQRSKYRTQSRTADYREILSKFIIERDGPHCGRCGKELNLKDRKSYQIDHFVPYRLGGSNDPSNIRLAHAKCNQKNRLEVRRKLHGY